MGPRRARVSASDVAREAGVSRTTVSFVLNNTPGKSITETTRQRVLAVAARLGYTPNESAQRLARTRNRCIGLFICHSQFLYSDAFITRAMEGMSQAANRLRARLIVQPVSLRQTSYLSIARRDEVDGIVLINTHGDDPGLGELADERFPTVSMDYIDSIAIDQVYVDNEAAAHEIVQHLTELGHRRIAMIAHAPPLFFASRARIAGYSRALADVGVEYDPAIVRHADFSERSGYDRMIELMETDDEFTAVFAANDVVAYGAMQALLHSERRIPQDVSLVGMDDDYMSRFLSPPLTTMALPAAGHGSAAVEVLMERIEGELGPPPVHRLLKAHISIRQSSGTPRVQP
ncbi:MAG: LacI family DNA-binding transcriptional regulator [Spirochaetota bacterium]